jgi:hypothetical protein
MAGLIFTYGILFALAVALGFALGAALHRALLGSVLLDLDGDVQSLRIRLTEAKKIQEGP